MKDRLKTTWKCSSQKHWLLDYIIVRQVDRWDVFITRVIHGAECWTDHRLSAGLTIVSTIRLDIPSCRSKMAPNKKLNCAALCNPNTIGNLGRLLAYNLAQLQEDVSGWPALSAVIHSAASGALGTKKKRHQDWFDSNSVQIQLFLEKKRNAYKDLLSNPGSSSLKSTFTKTRATIQQAIRTMEDTWWMQKAQEIKHLADCNDTQGFYDTIKTLYSPRRQIFTPVRSADGNNLLKDQQKILECWANHFETLLNHQTELI